MKKYFLNFLALAAVFATSCQTLDVTEPYYLTDEEVIELLEGDDENAAEMVLTAIGSTLNTYFNISGKSWSGYSDVDRNSQVDQDFLMSMRGNDVYIGNATTATSHHATAYRIDDGATYRMDRYTWPYFTISSEQVTAANKVLKFMTVDAAKESQDKASFRGQALALRAYAYMQLMEKFQPAYMQGGKNGKGMPLYTQYALNDPAPISSAVETYDFILSDLKEAVSLLNDYGFTEKYDDIDLGVAQFLLARAALEAGEWETAQNAAKAVVDKFPKLIAEANYGGKNSDFAAYCNKSLELNAEDNAFQTLANNPEVIMGFESGSNSNTYQNSFANVFAPSYAGYNEEAPCIDDRLYNMIDANDFRKDIFTTSSSNYEYITDENATKIYTRTIPRYANLKWAATIAKGRTERTNHLECDNIIFRASEAYLMLAEAYAQGGKDSQAKDVLNSLLKSRTKSGKTSLTCDTYASMAGKTALEMVQIQTRIEMWLEGGREFYNNKRWGIPVNRSNSSNHYWKNNGLSVDQMVLEIPIDERSTNTHWAD